MILLIPVCYQICSGIGLNNGFTNSQLGGWTADLLISISLLHLAPLNQTKVRACCRPAAVTQPNNYYLGCVAWKVSILMLFYPVLSGFCNKMENYRVIISVNKSENHIWYMYTILYKCMIMCIWSYILPRYHLNLANFFHHTVNFIISTWNLMPWQTVTSKPNSSDWELYQGNQANPPVRQWLYRQRLL